MTPIWGAHLPEIQASGSRCAARQVAEIAGECTTGGSAGTRCSSFSVHQEENRWK